MLTARAFLAIAVVGLLAGLILGALAQLWGTSGLAAAGAALAGGLAAILSSLEQR